MEKTFQIGEIARFFQIPASTLRYWDSCGVLHAKKNTDNHYRRYTVEDLMTISDVLFYKSLGLPLKQIRTIEQLSLQEQQQLLEDKMQVLEQEQQMLHQRMEKLGHHLDACTRLEELRRHPYTPTDIDTECILSFEWLEQEKLLQYIENPSLYARVQHSANPAQEQRGLAVPASMAAQVPSSQVLWQKTGHSYITCLLQEEISEGFPNNLQEHLDHLQQTWKTGAIISRFLLCAQENGRLYDFYQTWIEILDD